MEDEHRKRAKEKGETAIDVIDCLPTVDEKWRLKLVTEVPDDEGVVKIIEGERLIVPVPVSEAGAEGPGAGRAPEPKPPALLEAGRDPNYAAVSKTGGLEVTYKVKAGTEAKTQFAGQSSKENLFKYENNIVPNVELGLGRIWLIERTEMAEEQSLVRLSIHTSNVDTSHSIFAFTTV